MIPGFQKVIIYSPGLEQARTQAREYVGNRSFMDWFEYFDAPNLTWFVSFYVEIPVGQPA